MRGRTPTFRFFRHIDEIAGRFRLDADGYVRLVGASERRPILMAERSARSLAMASAQGSPTRCPWQELASQALRLGRGWRSGR